MRFFTVRMLGGGGATIFLVFCVVVYQKKYRTRKAEKNTKYISLLPRFVPIGLPALAPPTFAIPATPPAQL